VKGIAETGFLVAFANRNDAHHDWALGLQAGDEPLLTCEAVLAETFRARPFLADLCLIGMSELYPRHTVITVDRTDFRGFRRNKRETIPLICPPESR
jgi:hypothetical protein